MTREEFYRLCDALEPDEYGCRHWLGVRGKWPIGYCCGVGIAGKRHQASRVILERKLRRPIRPGYQALHHCDCGSCVTPEHIYEGTYSDNIRDRKERQPESWRYTRTPKERAKNLANLKKGRETLATKLAEASEYRVKVNVDNKRRWADPEYRAKMLIAVKRGREKHKQKWATDERYREKMMANLSKGNPAAVEARRRKAEKDKKE